MEICERYCMVRDGSVGFQGAGNGKTILTFLLIVEIR